MSFWIYCCKKCKPKLKRITKKRGDRISWVTDADRRHRCDVDGCKERASHEVGIAERGEMTVGERVREALDHPERFVPYKIKED